MTHFILSYFLHSHRLLLNLLGFPDPIPLTNSFLLAPPVPFCFLSISHDSHGLTTSFFGASLAHLLSLGPHYYFVSLWNIIPAILAQWSLFCRFLFLLFSYCWASSAIGSFCQKMGINNTKPESNWLVHTYIFRV